MSNTLSWIKAIRLPIIGMALVLTSVSFKIVDWNNVVYIVLAFIGIVTAATMIQNDLRDREHDLKKGKLFAYANAETFCKVAVYLWIVALLLALVLWRINIGFGILSLIIISSGLLYSELRKLPLIPVTTVALTDATATLYPLVLAQTKVTWVLFAATFVIMFARESLKDFEDIDIDRDYKWTLPVKIGIKATESIIAVLIILTPAIMLLITNKIWLGVPALIVALYFLLIKHNYTATKRLIDLGLLIVLIVLLFFGL